EGRPLGVMSVFRDVTERRRLEQEKADFLSMVTHDLKSPLTTVLGYTALLLEGGMGELNADVGESVEAIDRSGKKLLSLIEDFMTLCRYDSGVKAPAFAPVHMGRIAEAVVSSCWPEASRTGKLLELHAPPELPSVPGDPKQLERLLGNLIDNALKFTGRDGHIVVTLAVREEEDVAGKLGTKPVSRGRHLEVSVKDDGIGVPEAELPHLFERYWRGRQSGAFKGSGLGLAIVKCLADGHGASIKAESVEGSGSAFYVWLPLSPTRP
ncbi:MAG TPA: HAMP domain-containing sensor histidine kinase, partial [Nitrospirota bacterium]|nr:HAMP domain-containing sensor histidine kinase [Nitrospirota bacterium]